MTLFGYLEIRDLLHVAMVNKHLQDVSCHDAVWRPLSKRRWGVESLDKWTSLGTFKLVYSALYKSRHLHGCWVANRVPRGGVLGVHIADGFLQANFCVPDVPTENE